MELGTLIDRESIRDCLARLARGEDRRDRGLITRCYWSDAVTDFGMFQGSFADYLAWVVPGADAITNTQHVLGQSLIMLEGESARVETHVVAQHRVDMGSSEQDMCIGGRYLDRFAKRGGVWRIASRTMLYDWVQQWGAAADWSQGMMGMPFSDPHFGGQAKGDFSEEFFAG